MNINIILEDFKGNLPVRRSVLDELIAVLPMAAGKQLIRITLEDNKGAKILLDDEEITIFNLSIRFWYNAEYVTVKRSYDHTENVYGVSMIGETTDTDYMLWDRSITRSITWEWSKDSPFKFVLEAYA